MGASATVYCLTELTDYLEFERLCHDLMSLVGYGDIEPLGGFSDKGRDAVHTSQDKVHTIFAYSVREDWQAKLAEDADKIRRHGHQCDQLVFVTTAAITSSERDKAIASIKSEYGWHLALYDVERLRVLLDADYPHVKTNHPQIFSPVMLSLEANQSASLADHLFVSYAPEDGVLARWLSQRLTAEGYRVWCEELGSLGDDTYPDDIDAAIRTRTFRVIALYSEASLNNAEITRQRNLALSLVQGGKASLLLPIRVSRFSTVRLDRMTASLKFISFEDGWAQGLRSLLETLESAGCPKPVYHGRSIAASTFLDAGIVTDAPETLFTNCLEIQSLPKVIYRYRTSDDITRRESDDLQLTWPHRRVNSNVFLSFCEPSPSVTSSHVFRPDGGGSCADTRYLDGIRVSHLVSELIKRSLSALCRQKGLGSCQQTGLQYFPFGLVSGNRLRVERPDSSQTFVLCAGERKYWRPSGSQYYRYYLSPVFQVRRDLLWTYTVLLSIRVRLTDQQGTLLPKRQILSRRKSLCRDWWNREWFNRMLGVLQFLADGDIIRYGADQQLIISSTPWSVDAPKRIDEATLAEVDAVTAGLAAGDETEELDDDMEESEVSDG